MQKAFVLAAFSMAIAILLGAVGAHALRQVVDVHSLANFKTAVTYQVWHSLAIVLLCIAAPKFLTVKKALIAVYLFFGGILFFSGSLYLLSLRHVLEIDNWTHLIGPVTPIGGLFFIAGWIYTGIGIWRSPQPLTSQ